MLQRFRGRGAFITGGASGIGLGMAEEFVAHGLSVVLADVDVAAAEAEAARLRAAGSKACAFELDVRDPAAWETALDYAESEVGPLGIICANAGVAGSVLPIAETSLEGWEWTMRVNLDGCFFGMRAGVPRLLRHGQPAHFVATSSAGAFVPSPGNGLYTAAKAGVIALCETLRAEMEGTKVGVSVLCPGLVKTSLLARNQQLAPRGVEVGGHNAHVQAAIETAMPARKVGEIVARGIDAGEFWHFTSPEMRELIKPRMRELDEATARISAEDL